MSIGGSQRQPFHKPVTFRKLPLEPIRAILLSAPIEAQPIRAGIKGICSRKPKEPAEPVFQVLEFVFHRFNFGLIAEKCQVRFAHAACSRSFACPSVRPVPAFHARPSAPIAKAKQTSSSHKTSIRAILSVLPSICRNLLFICMVKAK